MHPVLGPVLLFLVLVGIAVIGAIGGNITP